MAVKFGRPLASQTATKDILSDSARTSTSMTPKTSSMGSFGANSTRSVKERSAIMRKKAARGIGGFSGLTNMGKPKMTSGSKSPFLGRNF